MICASLSVPRSKPVTPVALLAAIQNPTGTVEARGIIEQLVTEISQTRIMEMVREGTTTWHDLAAATAKIDIQNGENTTWIHEMAQTHFLPT